MYTVHTMIYFFVSWLHISDILISLFLVCLNSQKHYDNLLGKNKTIKSIERAEVLQKNLKKRLVVGI